MDTWARAATASTLVRRREKISRRRQDGGPFPGRTLADEHGVDVTFGRAAPRAFDTVVGADGLHSATRALVFGPEQQFHRYLGYCFAGFTMPNVFGLHRETLIWNTPGRAAAIYALDRDEPVHVLLNVARPRSPLGAAPTPQERYELVAADFADAGCNIPALLTALRDADDPFVDEVAQIRMPRWSSGRVALVGDAAYAPSFLTGQGTGLALVGAYMLAGSLADRGPTAGFPAYEHETRAFVTANQNLVGTGDAALFPTTAAALERRNSTLRRLTAAPAVPEPAHSSLLLPTFGRRRAVPDGAGSP